MQHEDQRYIEALLRNDAPLIREIYQNHSQQVKSWIVKNSGTAADAKDIFQEALLAIYTKAAQGNLTLTSPFGALLLRICKNKWIDRLRKKSRSPEVRIEEEERLEDIQDTRILIDEIDSASQKELLLKKTFAQLSDLCQKLLHLLSTGMKPSEAAVELEMSNANAVYRRKKACTDRWRELFQEVHTPDR